MSGSGYSVGERVNRVERVVQLKWSGLWSGHILLKLKDILKEIGLLLSCLLSDSSS